jgi:hypothetical protein
MDEEYKLDVTDAKAVNEALEVYFNVTPYRVEHGVDFGGNPTQKRVANDVPHLDGFCALYGIAMEELERVVYPRVASICFSRFKHVMVVNGLHGLYESGPWGLTMKNLARWADKSESKVVSEVGEIEPEKLERALQFLLEKQRRELPITVNDSASNNSLLVSE